MIATKREKTAWKTGNSEFGYLVLSICICNGTSFFLTSRFFSTGTVVAGLGMPLTTLISRRQLDSVEISRSWPCVSLIGPALSTVPGLDFPRWVVCVDDHYPFVSLCSSKVPRFIRKVKADGGEPNVVMLLVMSYQLNVSARIASRHSNPS
jgi:hypothetical protein